MRIHLLANGMLNGESLQMCQDYWRPYLRGNTSYRTLETHIKHLCRNYEVTFEELFHKLLLIKAYDTQICCVCCGQMYELYNPCDLPDPKKFINWQCDDCQNFKQRGVVKLEDFLNTVPTFNDDCPF